jgi:conjugative relaxase-like TrwC/TraI family protein
MLSLGKLQPGQQQYYLATVAAGAEEYYTGAKEAPGEWTGRSAARLGLVGEVDAETLHLVLEGRDPRTGERLTRAQGAPKVPGFDATFCAPKTVSLLFALGDPEASNEVRNAHDTAMAAAMQVLEVEAARARRGRGGTDRHEAEGFLGASFRHRTSRAGDPHLHTHVLVANLVYCEHDQRWSALDARGLYGWAKTVGYLYEAQLRAELTHRLGLAWTPVRNGIADIDGFSREMLRAFSTRRREIEMHLEEHGETSPRAAQVAAYATRKAKDVEAPAESLYPEWRERARNLGLDEQTLAAMLDRCVVATVPHPTSAEAEVLFDRLAAPTGLTARSASFGRREVLQAISAALPNGGHISEILELADAFLTSPHVVALDHSGLRTGDVIRRRDGAVVITHVDEARWTTPEMLATEARLIDCALQRREEGVGVADGESVRAAIRSRSSLAGEQVRMLRSITQSGAGVDVVEGAAGTGKTYVLRAAREAWEASGYRVVGCALAARAAAQLEHGAAIPSMTLDRLLRDLDRDDGAALDARTVIVVDEASMVGTRKLARLLDHAQTAGAKVVLVGDHYQLPEIDAGGAFAGLAARLRVPQLVENRRQIEPWERDALAHLRAGDASLAFVAYQAHRRVRHNENGERLRGQLVEDWWTAYAHAHDSVMLAGRNTDIDDLNQRARDRLAVAGLIGPDLLEIDGRRFAIGDAILTTRNDYGLGVLNGTRATITQIDPSTGAVHARSHSREVMLPWKYVAAGHVTHAYAMTLHKAQGMTVHSAFVLADDTLDRPRAYTGLSRGTHHNALYLTDPPDERADERHAPEVANDNVARARQAMGRMLGKTMATDTRQRTNEPEPALRAVPPVPGHGEKQLRTGRAGVFSSP